MAEYAARLANSQDTIDRMRRVDALGLTPSGNPTLARSGLRPDGGGAVTVNSGQMSVSVTAFAAWIDGGASDAQVGYPVFLDAGKTLSIAAGHATLVRVDTVVAQVRDTAYDGSGSTDLRVYVVQGTPGAGAPALPQSAIPLRDISVHAGASSGTGGLTAANLSTDRRQYVTALGGILPVASAAERDALTALQSGALVYRRDVSALEVFGGSSWTRVSAPPRVSVARAAAQSIANGGYTAISFDTEVEDTDAMFAPTGTDITVKSAGIWLVTAVVGLVANSSGTRGVAVSKNGTQVATTLPAAPASGSFSAAVSTQIRCAVNDVITLSVTQTSGGALNTHTAAEIRPALQMTWLCA